MARTALSEVEGALARAPKKRRRQAREQKMKQIILLIALCAAMLAQAAPAAAQADAKEVYPGPIDVNKMDPALRAVGPYSFYVPPYNLYYFHHIDQMNIRQDWIHRSGPAFALREPITPFSASYTYANQQYTLDQYFDRNYVVGFIVLHDNQILLEKYFHGANRESRFLSNSVSKSFTSVLIGAAIADRKIKSVDDPVVKYLPWLKDSSGYRDTTIKNLLEMSSGVQFDEQYTNTHADILRYVSALLHGDPSFHDLALSIKTKIKPGTKFEYQTINTQVLGMTLEAATGKTLNQYAEEKLWSKIGPDGDAFYFRSKNQPQTCAGSALNVRLRDYARFGLMAMYGGTLGVMQVVPESWIKESTEPQGKVLQPQPTEPNDHQNFGYGYQWWLLDNDDGAFAAMGIYGQTIYANPKRHVVIVQTAAWPLPDPDERWDETIKVMQTVARGIQP
jgi:CubicO group peptidase (beta-lactamase class C family)